MIQRARDYWLLLRLHRPTGLWLMLWPMLWALWLAAASTPPPGVVAAFVLGAFVLRSAACIVDDLVDHWRHPGAERSPDRPIAQGRVSPRHALLLLAALALVLALLAAELDRLALLLSLPGIALAATYPFARRLHRVPHAHLGFAFSWSIPMACAALRQSMPWIEAGLLMEADLCWVARRVRIHVASIGSTMRADTEERHGTIRTNIQEQSGSAIVAAGERSTGSGRTRGRHRAGDVAALA